MQDTPTMMALIRQVGGQLDRLITHRFPLIEVETAWQLQLRGESAKVLLFPWANE